MRFQHHAHPGRCVRLAYCLNLHPARTPEGLLEELRAVTLPLRDALAPGREFGVGMYVPAELSRLLCSRGGARHLSRLAAQLAEWGLDPFTWNAFPFGGFGTGSLKARVFEPRWGELERAQYTAEVAFLARRLACGPGAQRHLSISTHTGWHTSKPLAEPSPEHGLASMAGRLHADEASSGWRVILALEAEPRANCNDTTELAALQRELAAAPARLCPPAARRVLGTCLDTCHSAVEFEIPNQALALATSAGVALGKLQFTSALVLRATQRSDLDALLALDEPRYLHQVTARTAEGTLLRVGDLPELRKAVDLPGGEAWWRGAELRCHFHVPVDLERLAGGPLTTTRKHADATLAAALSSPESWGTDELHVEIETYTWDVLPSAARGAGQLVDGLLREYEHVLGRLSTAGWIPA